MDKVHKIENKLAGVFKDLPAMPKNGRKAIVEWLPIIVLVVAVLQVLAAFSLIKVYRDADRFITGVQTVFGGMLGAPVGLSAFDKLIIITSIVMLFVQAAIMFMAYNPLKAKLKRGWDLLFLTSLLQVVYAVLTTFIDARGAGSMIMSLLGAAIGFYILFQIRDAYSKKAHALPKANS